MMHKINTNNLLFYEQMRGILSAQGQITLILEEGILKTRKGKMRTDHFRASVSLLCGPKTAECGLCTPPCWALAGNAGQEFRPWMFSQGINILQASL
jgi:hypothetical protein